MSIRACAPHLGRPPEQLHELELDTANDMIAIASIPGGRHRVDDRGALALPAAARRMCGITIGRPVILLAAVHQQILVVHPASALARLLAARYTTLMGARDAR